MSVLDAIADALTRHFFTECRRVSYDALELWSEPDDNEQSACVATLRCRDDLLTAVELTESSPSDECLTLWRLLLTAIRRTCITADEFADFKRHRSGSVIELKLVINYGYDLRCTHGDCKLYPADCPDSEEFEDITEILQLRYDCYDEETIGLP